MRLHTNKLTITDIYRAADTAGVELLRDSEHGSRSHERAFDVILSGSGRTGGQWGNSGNAGAAPHKAATWDEWGVFLGELFGKDHTIKCWAYANAADFHAQTGNRFRVFLPVAQRCAQHRWEYVSAGYSKCRKGCGATLNRSGVAA